MTKEIKVKTGCISCPFETDVEESDGAVWLCGAGLGQISISDVAYDSEFMAPIDCPLREDTILVIKG